MAGRAQRVVDMIVESDRFVNSKTLADRVYSDEPILRTGAEAFGRKDARAGDSSTSRPARQVGLARDGQSSRPAMPARYHRMRALAKKRTSWGYAYGTGGARLFYEQGKYMEDFEDDVPELVDLDGFHMYFPTYDEMNNRELRAYFSWRTHLRRGEVLKAPASFLFVHAYELLCGIGVEPGERGFAELKLFSQQYAAATPTFDMHMRRWMHDYVVYHGLDGSLLASFADSFSYESVALVRQAQEALLSQERGATWPEHGSDILPQPEALLDALCALSRYRAERSRFVKTHREEVAEVTARVFARMVAHCNKRRKTDYVDGLFGNPVRVSYSMFPSALFWSPVPHEDVRMQISPTEAYLCQRGFWWRELPCRRDVTNRELGDLLHAIDARMRIALDDKHPLKARSLPKYQAKFVDEEIAAFVARREAIQKAQIRIDRSSLRGIRTAAARTREALLTDEEREDEVRASEVVVASVRQVEHAQPIDDVVELPSTLDLDDAHIALLKSLLAREPVAGEDSMFLTLAVDAINEAFFDAVGDTVIEFDGDVPTLVEDYEPDVREALGEGTSV